MATQIRHQRATVGNSETAGEKTPALRRRRGRPRDPQTAGRRSAAILERAAGFFAERGFAEADVQELADALGVGKGTIYRHFASKQALFLATLEDGMRRLHTHVQAACAAAVDPLAQIERAARAYLEFFDAHPEYAELLIQERAAFKNRRAPTYFAHREKNVGRWRALFGELIAAGRVRPLPVEQITNVLSGLLYGTMFVNFFAGHRLPVARQACELLDIAWRGILTDAERGKRPVRGRRCGEVKGNSA